MGSVLWLNGSLYTGAGEFGHIILKKDGKLCYCGKRGCVDVYPAAYVLSVYPGDSLKCPFVRLEQGIPEIRSV